MVFGNSIRSFKQRITKPKNKTDYIERERKYDEQKRKKFLKEQSKRKK